MQAHAPSSAQVGWVLPSTHLHGISLSLPFALPQGWYLSIALAPTYHALTTRMLEHRQSLLSRCGWLLNIYFLPSNMSCSLPDCVLYAVHHSHGTSRPSTKHCPGVAGLTVKPVTCAAALTGHVLHGASGMTYLWTHVMCTCLMKVWHMP